MSFSEKKMVIKIWNNLYLKNLKIFFTYKILQVFKKSKKEAFKNFFLNVKYAILFKNNLSSIFKDSSYKNFLTSSKAFYKYLSPSFSILKSFYKSISSFAYLLSYS